MDSHSLKAASDLASMMDGLKGGWTEAYLPEPSHSMDLAGEILEAGGSDALMRASRSAHGRVLGSRFPMAVRMVAERHEGRYWAGTQLPTFDHAMDLSARLIQLGAGEDLAILALFHEGVDITPEELGSRFGSRIRELQPFCRPIALLPHPLEESWACPESPSLSTYPREAMLLHACDAILLAEGVLDDYQALLQNPSHPVDPLRIQLQGTFQTLCFVMSGDNILQFAEEATVWSRYGTKPDGWFQGMTNFLSSLHPHGLVAEAADLTAVLCRVGEALVQFQTQLLPRMDQVWEAIDSEDVTAILKRMGPSSLAAALQDPAWHRPKEAILQRLPKTASANIQRLLEDPHCISASAILSQEYLLRVIRSLAQEKRRFARSKPLPLI